LLRSGLPRQEDGERRTLQPAQPHRRRPGAAARHQGDGDQSQQRQEVEVEINDRSPYVRGRIIDLSKAAAERLGMKEGGTTLVRLEVTWAQSVEPARSS
jgi:hypothetical protein